MNTAQHQDLKKIRSYGPTVRLLEKDHVLVVEKSFNQRMLPIRIIGSLLIFWERLMYKKLQGIDGIPELMESPDRLTLVTRYMGGSNLRDGETSPGAAYFDQSRDIISAMHKRGIIHLDLRNRRNYGMDDSRRPYLVDFATCLYVPWPGSLRNLLSAIDWMGFVKVKHKINPDLLSPEEKNLYEFGTTLSSFWFPTRIVRILRSLSKTLSPADRTKTKP